MSNQLTINGLQLPASYCALAAKYEGFDGFCNLKLKNPKDSFGYPLECELAQIYSNEQKLKEITDSLNKYFVPDGYYGELDSNNTDPESLKDITDFKKLSVLALLVMAVNSVSTLEAAQMYQLLFGGKMITGEKYLIHSKSLFFYSPTLDHHKLNQTQ